MATVRFTLDEFKTQLAQELNISPQDFREGESYGEITLALDYKCGAFVEIRTTISPGNSNADDTGQDSIKVFVKTKANEWKINSIDLPKVYRTENWATNLSNIIKPLTNMLLWFPETVNIKQTGDTNTKGNIGKWYYTNSDNSWGSWYPNQTKIGDVWILNCNKSITNKNSDTQTTSNLLNKINKIVQEENGSKPVQKVEEKPEKEIKLTEEQIQFCEMAKLVSYGGSHDKGKNIVVHANAGTGKTTLLGVALGKYINPDLDIFVAAFGKRIAEELAKKMPSHVETSTIHSFAYRSHIATARTHGYKIKVEIKKTFYLYSDWINDKFDKDDKQSRARYWNSYGYVGKVISMLKLNIDKPTPENIARYTIAYTTATEDDEINIINELVPIIFNKSINRKDIVDYDDMLYNLATGNHGVKPMKTYHIVLVDELQDLNKVQQIVIGLMLNPDGIFIGVGDPDQAIMGFAGADRKSFYHMIELHNALVLPLSINWRCKDIILEEARKLVPEIRTADFNMEGGSVEYIPDNRLLTLVDENRGDFVLCRTNAPLAKPAMALLRRGIKAVILGKDIGGGLVTMINQVASKSDIKDDVKENMLIFIRELIKFERDKVNKLIAQNREDAADFLHDQVETILVIAETVDTIAELKSKIKLVFSDDVTGVTFSTIHKSKGLEAEFVAIIKPEILYPNQPDWGDPEQEKNLKYVAQTRAKNQLVYLTK